MRRIDQLRAPLFVSWQLTRDCDLACLHCCTESAPGKRVANELDAAESLAVAGELISCEVPYVMLCGGEPLLVPHFFAVAETLGAAGIHLKVETNGQRLDATVAARLAALPIRSVQISLDGATQETYARQRPGGDLARAHAACRAVHAAGLPLEVTFAPTRINIHEVEAVVIQARELGAFRFNTGQLMPIGTAAKLWGRLEPSEQQYREFRQTLDRLAASRSDDGMELCYIPFSIEEGLEHSLADPPATLLVLPNGWVKVAAVLPYICGDLRRDTLLDVWGAYRQSWRNAVIIDEASQTIATGARHNRANEWRVLASNQ